MAYETPHIDLMKALYTAHSCPFLIQGTLCAGGDYCPFPPGDDHACCFFCERFTDCPDPEGICTRFLD